MDCFNELLLRLREVHEREIEAWQLKVQELSNKKGCDTKRMEELFTRNQQMKEQQRILTENIKTLENRLRAGLCDRCTVTQEVAKRRQQEFEVSQMQTLQHITLLAAESTNLKKDNRRLRDEVASLRAALVDHSYNNSTTTTTEVKQNHSPDLSPPSGPVALTSTATCRAPNQPAGGDVAVKIEADQRNEETPSEHRPLRGTSRGYFPLSQTSWKTEHIASYTGERRPKSIDGSDQRPSIAPQALQLKNSSSSNSGDENPVRHVLNSPVPCRPQPIKGSPGTLPWTLSESSDWVSVVATGANVLIQPSPKTSLPRFPNLIQTTQPANHSDPRRHVFGSPWHKQSSPQPPAKESTLVLRLSNFSEPIKSQTKPQEKKEMPASKVETASGEGPRELYEGPLDLSDRGKSKSVQVPRSDSPWALEDREGPEKSSDEDAKINASENLPVSLPSPAVSPSACSALSVQQDEDPTSNYQNYKDIKEEENGKKISVLTSSLRPVVVLETLNSALQKQESLSTNGQSSWSAAEPGSSSEEQEEEGGAPGQENNQSCKRKRLSVETDSERDSDTDNVAQGRKIRITLRTPEKSSS
ncbi:uncharacterized protein rbbp8l isoform 2-T2 [Aulostomus maculatus]